MLAVHVSLRVSVVAGRLAVRWLGLAMAGVAVPVVKSRECRLFLGDVS